MITELRTFVGDVVNGIADGFADFRLGQQYQLKYERQGTGLVTVMLDHQAHENPAERLLAVKEAQFEKWFVPVV